MDFALLLALGGAVFGASLLQSATGIGYGVIAGPIFLIAMNGVEAFQISTLHNLAIALLLAPALVRTINTRLLGLLVVGSAPGIGLGFILQFSIGITALKLATAAMIGFVAATLIRDLRRRGSAPARFNHSAGEAGAVGFVSGIMGGMLAMPGPFAATWMAVRRYDRAAIRATILALFIFAYGTNVMLYLLTTGFADRVPALSLLLGLPLIGGVVAGHFVARCLSETTFRYVLLAILLVTVALLLRSVLFA